MIFVIGTIIFLADLAVAFQGPSVQSNRAAPLFATTATASQTQVPIRKLEQNWRVLPDLWSSMAKLIPNETMLMDVIREPNQQISFKTGNALITTIAAGLQKLGLLSGDCVSLFSENSYKWFLIDQGVMKAGGCNAVRGAQASTSELRYIYDNSGSMGLIVENIELLKSLYEQDLLKSKGGSPKFVVVLYSEGQNGSKIRDMIPTISKDTSVLSFEELISSAKESEFRSVMRDAESTATLVYTSGTTSKPKGVILRHRNILHQVTSNSFSRDFNSPSNPNIKDVFLSILPCWHIFERTAEYYFLSRGCTLVYSNLRNFKSDFQRWRPHYLVVVPRLIETIQKGVVSNLRQQTGAKKTLVEVFTFLSTAFKSARRTYSNAVLGEQGGSLVSRLVASLVALFLWPLHKLGDAMVWRKVRQNLGGRLKVIVSGGSLLPLAVEKFYQMLGLNIIVGYGLTETSPTITSRLLESNVLGSVGKATPKTTIKIVNPDTRIEVSKGKTGLILAKGPSVMAGYIGNESATKEAIDSEGYFNTGDLGKLSHSGDIVITGRAKDTIVLSNGENIEPEPIEQHLIAKSSSLIDQAVVVGQDQRYLSALLVLSVPELVNRGLLSKQRGSELASLIGATPLLGLAGSDLELRKEEARLNSDPAVRDAVRASIAEVCTHLQPWEKVAAFHLLLTPFSVSNGVMTQTLKIKRQAVTEIYAGAISSLYLPNQRKSGNSKQTI